MTNRKSIQYLCDDYLKNNYIDPEVSEKLSVKRGLRNSNGTGVLAGLTNICDVVGYELINDVKTPIEGKLIYRGIDVEQLVLAAAKEDRFIFEEVVFLLIFGHLPTAVQLQDFKQILFEHRELPPFFAEDMINKAPSPNVMNKLQRSVLALYSYDENPEDLSLQNLMEQSLFLIASLPTIMINAYQIKRRVYDKLSMFFHPAKENESTAQHILSTNRLTQEYTLEEAQLLDICMVLHADHGGGNNSTFSCRVLSSSATDTYSAISAAIGSLKGPKHGGANLKVMEMLDYIKKGVKNYQSEAEIRDFLCKIVDKKEGDKTGLIYGLGHAVYTAGDPRAKILRERAKPLAEKKGLIDDYNILCAVEKLGPLVFAEKKGTKEICANVDLYSGLIYKMLGISEDLFTPLFAISRIPGWCAHRVEEVVFANRIIRPAYKCIQSPQKYIPLSERK